MEKEYTRVLFVYPQYPDGQREVLALFVDDISRHIRNPKKRVGSYARIGQHGEACASFLRRKQATPCQYKPLMRELTGLGYNLIVLNSPNTLAQLFRDLTPDYDAGYDPWGYAMQTAFDVGAACVSRGLANPLDFQPGMGGCVIEDDYRRKVLLRMNPAKLERFASFTNRVLDQLKRAGKDY